MKTSQAFEIKTEKTKYHLHLAVTPFIEDGTYWFFDNGQYGEKTMNTFREEYSLCYFYNRVYVSGRYRHNGEGGVTTGNFQCPITGFMDTPKIEIFKALFEADKKAGVISTDYKFE